MCKNLKKNLEEETNVHSFLGIRYSFLDRFITTIDTIFNFKFYHTVLPRSQFTGTGCKPSDIIIAPPCDELDAAALDAGIEPHPLSPKQLHSIREKG